jgi:hypothetical protein
MAHYVMGSLAAKIQNSDNATFDVFNLLNWILLLTYCIASIALLWDIILSVRLRALILIVASARQITAQNFPTLLVYARTTTVFPPVISVSQNALIYTDHHYNIATAPVWILVFIAISFLVIKIYTMLKKITYS